MNVSSYDYYTHITIKNFESFGEKKQTLHLAQPIEGKPGSGLTLINNACWDNLENRQNNLIYALLICGGIKFHNSSDFEIKFFKNETCVRSLALSQEKEYILPNFFFQKVVENPSCIADTNLVDFAPYGLPADGFFAYRILELVKEIEDIKNNKDKFNKLKYLLSDLLNYEGFLLNELLDCIQNIEYIKNKTIPRFLVNNFLFFVEVLKEKKNCLIVEKIKTFFDVTFKNFITKVLAEKSQNRQIIAFTDQISPFLDFVKNGAVINELFQEDERVNTILTGNFKENTCIRKIKHLTT